MHVDSSEEELLTVTQVSDSVNALRDSDSHKVFATMLIDGKQIKMQIDSGATCNILPKKFVPSTASISETRKELVSFCKNKLQAVGVANISFRNAKNNKKYRAEFVIVDGDYTPIIGASAAQKMELIVVQKHNILQVSPPSAQKLKEDLLSEYKDVFEGLGKMEGKLHLEKDPSVKPVIMAPRRVPIATKAKLKEELDRLEEMEVILKQETPTDWVSSLVVAEKTDGRVRVCIDPLHLNKALKRSHYPLPIIDEILPELSKAKVFTKLDLKDGFLQVQLDEESSELTTFQTPWGRYRWLRMPFGITPAPEYFQQKLDQNLEGLKGTFKIADGILVIGQGDDPEKDHDENLRNLLERCRDRNIKLNPKKVVYKADTVPFIGHLLTKNGVKPDPSKVDAITNIERPKDVEAVRRLVGMVKYLSKFLQHLSTVSEPLRRLTHKDQPFIWEQEQEDSFQRIKEMVSQAPILRYYDSTQPLEGQGDASSTGLGFTLMQNGQPVTFSSRALTSAERNYAQIEKELLALVYGLEHNHQYVYGKPVKLISDHKPLVSIYKKPLATAPKRLQRLLLRLQQYDVTIEYLQGKEMYIADTLSRAHPIGTKARSQTEEEAEIIHTAQFLAISAPQIKEIQDETSRDSTLLQLMTTIHDGWPTIKAEVPFSIRPYFTIRDELTTLDGIIFKGQRCVIPTTLRSKIKTKIHSSHTGIQSCLRRARELIYWPGMNKDLFDYISNCDICASQQKAQAKEPLIHHEQPSNPWEKIATDIFTHNGKDYLCTVDYYSDFFEVDLLSKKTSAAITSKLKKLFATHGIPLVLITDNGPPFDSDDFASFARLYEFTHNTSSPHYPQSNGKVENTIGIAKRLLEKSTRAETDYELALLDWRNTPTEGIDSSPAQRLFSRRTRTTLPTSKELLKPSIVKVSEKKEARKEKMSKYYNVHTKPLPSLEKGDRVNVALRPNEKKKRRTAAVVKGEVAPRSYEVETEEGVSYRRNRRHIRSLPNHKSHDNDREASTSIPNNPPLRRSKRIRSTPYYMKDFV